MTRHHGLPRTARHVTRNRHPQPGVSSRPYTSRPGPPTPATAPQRRRHAVSGNSVSSGVPGVKSKATSPRRRGGGAGVVRHTSRGCTVPAGARRRGPPAPGERTGRLPARPSVRPRPAGARRPRPRCSEATDAPPARGSGPAQAGVQANCAFEQLAEIFSDDSAGRPAARARPWDMPTRSCQYWLFR